MTFFLQEFILHIEAKYRIRRGLTDLPPDSMVAPYPPPSIGALFRNASTGSECNGLALAAQTFKGDRLISLPPTAGSPPPLS